MSAFLQSKFQRKWPSKHTNLVPQDAPKKLHFSRFFSYFCHIPYPKIVVFKCKTQVFINRKNVAKKRDFPDFLTIFCCTFLIKNTFVFLFCVFYFYFFISISYCRWMPDNGRWLQTLKSVSDSSLVRVIGCSSDHTILPTCEAQFQNGFESFWKYQCRLHKNQ